MIVDCENCNKKFKVDPNLIPSNGREIQCGSCNHIWFYKHKIKEKENLGIKTDRSKNKTEKKIDIRPNQIQINKNIKNPNELKINTNNFEKKK